MAFSLVEIHSVQVFIDKTEGASNEIYGEIRVEDYGEGDMDLYKVGKDDSKHISVDGVLPVSGPSRCISKETCSITVLLKERHLDLEVGNGFLSLKCAPVDYDMPHGIVINGDHGYTVLHLSWFKYAIQALVKVSLFPNRDNSKDQYAIYGEVLARHSIYKYDTKYSRTYHKTRLFDCPQEKAIKLSMEARDNVDEPTEAISEKIVQIPLSRYAVAVPLDCWLVVEANLCDNDDPGVSSQDHPTQVVSGKAAFFAELGVCGTGPLIHTIDRNYGRIEVSVTWDDDIPLKYSKGLRLLKLGSR